MGSQLQKPLIGTQINWGHPLSRGLVGCWLMNEGAGDRIYDLSLNGNDGVFVNDPAWQPGQDGIVVGFDGADSIDVGDSAILNFGTSINFTIFARIKRSSIGNFDFIIDKRSSNNNGYIFFITNGNKVGFNINAVDTISTDSIADTKWYSVIGVANRSENAQIYIDGIANGSAVDISGAGNVTKAVDLIISGRSFNRPAHIFDGPIGDVRIWNRALTSQEISELYLNPYGMFEHLPIWKILPASRETFENLALLTNVKRSLEKYIHDNLYTTENLSVDFDGIPFDDSAIAESWLQPRIVNVNREYARQSSNIKYGNDTDIELKFSIFVKKSGTTLTHKHYLLRDKVANYFKIGEDINLKDYVGDSSTLTNMRVRNISSDFPLPETNELLGYEVSWMINYTEEITQAIR